MADITIKVLQPATSTDLARLEEIKADDRHGPEQRQRGCASARPSSGVIG